MINKIIVFTHEKNFNDLFALHEIVKKFKATIVLCDNKDLFHRAYDCNVCSILHYENDFEALKKIVDQYPKSIRFNIINIKTFISDNLSLNSNKNPLTNKFLMAHFLNLINMHSLKIQEIIIKRVLVNAVNFNFLKINSSLLYFTISELNLNPKVLIPTIRDFLKNWYDLHIDVILKKFPDFRINSFRINNTLTMILKLYNFYISNHINNKNSLQVLENAFYLEKFYENNITLNKKIKSLIDINN